MHDKLLLHAFGIEIEDEFLDEFLVRIMIEHFGHFSSISLISRDRVKIT